MHYLVNYSRSDKYCTTFLWELCKIALTSLVLASHLVRPQPIGPKLCGFRFFFFFLILCKITVSLLLEKDIYIKNWHVVWYWFNQKAFF